MSHSKIVLVTGGGRGIGAATAKLFASHGYSVCINYKSNSETAQKVVDEIESAGGRCISVQADVSQESDVQRLFEAIDRELGTLSVLVNNAGILQAQTRLDEMTAERINTILTNNVTSYFLCCKEAVRRMSTRHGGKVE
ncbi:putative oxidoreductase [Vibrio ishigakensis]|uniref:Putative oxidoreductase n=1 Tax=Vibrio ishigakensis TaxID=1481914 RepID=A0A0B8PNC9_9VIBR|nr:putative oxidoreductase [Vibrio ishigakensis]